MTTPLSAEYLSQLEFNIFIRGFNPRVESFKPRAEVKILPVDEDTLKEECYQLGKEIKWRQDAREFDGEMCSCGGGAKQVCNCGHDEWAQASLKAIGWVDNNGDALPMPV